MEVSILPRWCLKHLNRSVVLAELVRKRGQQWAPVARWSSLRSIRPSSLLDFKLNHKRKKERERCN